jgi:hypothetical protein
LVGVRPDPEVSTVPCGDLYATVVLAGSPASAPGAVTLDDLDPRGVRVAGLARADVYLVEVSGDQVVVVTHGRLLLQVLAVRDPVEPSAMLRVVSNPNRGHRSTLAPRTDIRQSRSG